MSGVQLRLGFEEPTTHVTLFLRAAGVRVAVECHHGVANDAHAYLSAAGLDPEMTTASGLVFPLSKFRELANVSDNCAVVADATLRPLLDWVERPPDDGFAAELELGADGTLWLTWTTGETRLSEPLSDASATALLVADIPFVAAPGPLAVLREKCPLPILIARLRTHRSGYIEVETSKPGMLEMHSIPGLFRLDETIYGIPFASLPYVEHLDGFMWDGSFPQLDSGPRQLPPMPARLSAHVTEDLRRLVDSLAAYRTQVVVWDSGLGRRVFVLAALVALDAFPAVVVCRPDRVWQWWRHAALFSRTRGVDADDVDLRVLTYAQFVANPAVAYEAQTLIFDDVASADADTPEVAAAAVGVGGMLDCYLVGITNRLPDDPKQLAGVMARLRPAEFSASVALMDRYGTDVRNGLFQHVAAYLSRRTGTDPGADRQPQTFNHTQVHPVQVNDELTRELAALNDKGLDPADLVAAAREMVSAGSAYCLSPKVAITAGMATAAVDSGRRVAVVTDYRRTASLLAGLLRDHAPEVVRPGSDVVPKSRLVLVEGMSALPDLSWFDEVIVVDYPTSYSILDAAVGHPDAEYAPSVVTLLHAENTIDDHLAVRAARAEEQARLARDTQPHASDPQKRTSDAATASAGGPGCGSGDGSGGGAVTAVSPSNLATAARLTPIPMTAALSHSDLDGSATAQVDADVDDDDLFSGLFDTEST